MNNRNRFAYVALVLSVVALGLASRHFQTLPSFVHAPSFVHVYVGDMLWALMVFLIFGFLLPRQTSLRLGLYALCFSFCIEFSQLYHAPWIDAIRQNRLGGLVLGFGFLWSDLLAYIVGTSLGMLAEYGASLLSRQFWKNSTADYFVSMAQASADTPGIRPAGSSSAESRRSSEGLSSS